VKSVLKSKKVMIITIILLLAMVAIITIVTVTGDNKGEKDLDQLSLGEKYLTELKYDQAVIAFSKAIEIEPKNTRAYLGIADAYLHLDRQLDAVNLLGRGIEATDNENLKKALIGVEKSIIEGYIAIAEAYEAEGWHDRSLEILQRVYEETSNEVIGRKLGIIEASEIEFRDDYIIQWKDAEFERLIRQYLGKVNGEDIHYDDVKLISNLQIWGDIIAKESEINSYNDHTWFSELAWYGEDSFGLQNGESYDKNGAIQSLDDLEHFTSLKWLTICHQMNLDISALGNTDNIDCLKRLQHLTLASNDITDISVISNLISLKTLNLSYNSIKDIAPISMLIELTSLDIDGSDELTSIDELRGLRKLNSVYISGFASADLNIFLSMPELSSLQLMRLGEADYSVLPNLSKLNHLSISCDNDNFKFIKQIKTLTSLRLYGYGIWSETEVIGGLTDISGIGELSNLKSLALLSNNCYDISPLASLGIEEIEIDLPKDCDLTPLKSLPNLKTVIVDSYVGEWDSTEDDSHIEKIKALLPNVEVKSNRH